MPSLLHFQRKWLIASDDFVIPFIIEAFLRALWLVGTLIVTWFENPECNDKTLHVKYFLYSIIGHLLLTICLCIGISVMSSKGSILQDHKRIHLSKILYAKSVTIICDVVVASFCIWLLLQRPNLCAQWKKFFQAVVICFYMYVFAAIIGVFVCYKFLGSTFYWSSSNNDNSAKILKKAEHVWRLRLKLFCCCADVSEDENDFIFVEISNFLMAFTKDIDLTPTDILAGLITLSKKHDVERRKYKWLHTSDALLANEPTPSWMTAENALYYLRIAKSTYGWFALFNSLHPWNLCSLISPSRCLHGCFNPQNSLKHGDCCYCNSSAVEKMSGLKDSDILYASFTSLIYEPAFLITIDHNKKAIIIAIRGTCSFSDLVTDIDMEEMIFPSDILAGKLKCHRGALRSALFIQKKISELQILKRTLTENPSYHLVITGHSLGASIAAILSLLLHPEYPSLQCYSFAPLAALSEEGVARTLDFVFSVVVGHDMIPRVNVYSCKELIKQIYVSLEETQFPKYKILTAAFWNYIKRSLKLSQSKVSSRLEAYENTQVEGSDEPPVEEVQLNISSNEAQLYAPGRILHLRRSKRCDYSWVTGFHMQNIIISPSVMKDHQPHQIKFLLETYKHFVENEGQSQENSGHFKTEVV